MLRRIRVCTARCRALAIGLASGAIALACDPALAARLPAEIEQRGFVYCVNGAVNTFNPQMAINGPIIDVLSAQLYDRLLDIDPYTYRLVPSLAVRWEVLDEGRLFRFYLHRDIPFQRTAWFTPTRTLNADDVVFTLQRLFDFQSPWHKVNGGHYPYFDSLQYTDKVESIEKRDDYTVDVRLKTPDAAFLWHLATYYAPILSAEYAEQLTRQKREAQLDRLPVGTGPFLLDRYRSGQYLRLVRNEHYWRGVPGMPQVVIDLSEGGTGQLSKMLTGECDVLAYPVASQLAALKNDPRLRLMFRPGMNVAYLAFNTRKAPLDNKFVRRALAMAINNRRLLQAIYYGTAEPAVSILPRVSWAYDNQLPAVPYNPTQAYQLLQALGVHKLKLDLWVPTASESWNPSPLKMAELIQADLAHIGIRVNIVPIKGRLAKTRLTGKGYDLLLTGWNTDSNDPDSFFHPLLSCAAIASRTNYAHWCNRNFDMLLENALLTPALSPRMENYLAAQRLLADELPMLPLASSLRQQAYRYDIKGLVLSPFGNISFAGVYRDMSATPLGVTP